MIAKINGEPPLVIKNDEMSFREINELEIDNIIISPGPGHPDNSKDFGICKEIILQSSLPILGVCLGHQGIYSASGGQIIKAALPMHGRSSVIRHNQDLIFREVPPEFKVIRYHSLVAHSKVPQDLEVIATTHDNVIMAIKHKTKPIWGFQFHPESISSEYGFQLLENFKNLTNSKRHKKTSVSSLLRLQKTKSKYTHELFIKKITADYETLFTTLFDEDTQAVWLDSNMLSLSHQFSILGSLSGPLSYQIKYNMTGQTIIIKNENTTTTKNIDIFTFLNEQLKQFSVKVPELELPFDFNCGFVGYLGYELKGETTNVSNRFISELPDAQFIFLDRAIVYDHLEDNCYLLCLSSVNNQKEADFWFNNVIDKLQQPRKFTGTVKKRGYIDLKYSQSRHQYLNNIARSKEYICSGDSYEICLTNKLKTSIKIDPLEYFSLLRLNNPAPHSAFLKFDDCSIACASMERFIKVNKERQVETKPIKGTLPRGKTPLEDQQLAFELKNNEKFTSENLMIVDLLRNDLGKVCEIDSIEVPHLMEVESYQTVHQLVSTIRGKLLDHFTAVECVKQCFPGGSMTGAPKIRTLELLDTLEQEARGIYSGAIGYFALNGTADFNIVIRTAVITDNEVSIGVGGAIVALSNAEEEYKEMILKSKALVETLKQII